MRIKGTLDGAERLPLGGPRILTARAIVAVEVIGLGTGVAGMVWLATRLLFLAGFIPGLVRGLEVRRNHAGWCGRRGR